MFCSPTKRLMIAAALCASVACGTDDDGSLPETTFSPSTTTADASATLADAAVFTPIAYPDASTPLDGSTVTGEGGARGDGGSGDASTPDGGTGIAKLKPKCVKKDSQVMIIGDSFINWISHKFPEQIKTATGQNWRMLAVGGTSMGSGGIGSIPQQFYDGIKADPDAHTVVMDGGGNDILVADLGYDNPFDSKCKATGSSQLPNCQKIVQIALDTASTLMEKAAAAGIRDVVYFFYPYVPRNRAIGTENPNEILDYALPKVRDFCNNVEAKTNGKTRCHFIDMIPVFKGHTPTIDPGVEAGSAIDWFNGDIHPNEKGSQAEVDAIWKLMQERCLGQKNKDCCEP